MIWKKNKIHKMNKILIIHHQSYFILHTEKQSREDIDWEREEEKYFYQINHQPEVYLVSPFYFPTMAVVYIKLTPKYKNVA